MNKVWNHIGVAPWDAEADFYTKNIGLDPAKARTFVVMRWTWHGDFRPLLAAIREHRVDQDMLNQLGVMIMEGRLQVHRPRRGRSLNVEAGIRNIVAAKAYEHSAPNWDDGSDELFERIANATGVSVESVRRAVTRWRKRRRQSAYSSS
jgi:hypothetical protein